MNLYISSLGQIPEVLRERFGSNVEIDDGQDELEFVTAVFFGVHSFSFSWSRVPGQSLGFVHNLPGGIRQVVLLGEDSAFIPNTAAGVAAALDRIERFCVSPEPPDVPNVGWLAAPSGEGASEVRGVSKISHLRFILRAVFGGRFAVGSLALTFKFVLDERFVFEVEWIGEMLQLSAIQDGEAAASACLRSFTKTVANNRDGIGALVEALDQYCRERL
jgi:hypothetical protein